MKCGTAHFVIACILVLSAGLGASAARHVSSSSYRRLAQAGQAQGCQGITFAQVTAATSGPSIGASSVVFGNVVISKSPSSPVTLDQVLVQAFTNAPRPAPVFTKAVCGAFSPAGTITCTFQFDVPNSVPWPGFQPSVQAIAAVHGSGSCYSAITPITQVQVGEGHGVMDYSQGSTSTESSPAMPATSNGGRRLSQADDLQLKNALQMAKDGSLANVPAAALKSIPPSPCQGITFSKVIADSNSPAAGPASIVSGTVVISSSAALDQVVVQAFTNAPSVAPPSTAATCGAASADGTITCTYQMQVPNGPFIPGLAIRPSVQAIATAHGRTSGCPSAIIPINYA